MLKETKPLFIRRTLLTGLLSLLPLFITYLLFAFLFNLFTGVGAPLVRGLLPFLGADGYGWVGPLAPLVNLLLSLGVVFLLGLIATNIFGRKLLESFESLLMRLPLVKTVYGGAKQLVETVQGADRSFQRVVLLQYPSRGASG